MGLDVYVGPLVRYHTGNWELITQQAATAAGLEFHLARANPVPDDAITDPEIVRQAILAWRLSLRDHSGKALADIDWPELPQGEYWTDKPDWDGYWALRTLAGSEEFPGVERPASIPQPSGLNQLMAGPLVRRIRDIYQLKSGGLLRGLLGRSTPVSGTRYPNLHLPELWLPCAIAAPFAARDLVGNRVIIGSVEGLLAELEALNDRTLRGDAAALDAWKRGGSPTDVVFVVGENGSLQREDGLPFDSDEPGPPADRSLNAVARFGLAVFLEGARYAAKNRLPIKLDY